MTAYARRAAYARAWLREVFGPYCIGFVATAVVVAVLWFAGAWLLRHVLGVEVSR